MQAFDQRLLFPHGTIVVLCLALGIPATAQDAKSVRTWPAKNNMLKNLVVEVPAGEAEPKKALQYTFHLLITGSDMVDGRDCWKLAFVPGDQTPKQTKRRTEVLVDKEFGWPRRVTAVQASSDAKVRKVGEGHVIVDAENDIPIDMLPLVPAQEFEDRSAKIKLKTARTGSEVLVDLAYLIDGAEKFRVRQRWSEGEDWWRYYEKQVDGKVVLRARQANMPPIADAFTKAPSPPPQKADENPLRADQRLYALVQIEPKRPSVQHVISQIKEATKVDIELDPQLDGHVPDLGYISPNPKGYFAWQLMEHLAKTEMDRGRWEKTKTGYRLIGTSKVPPGRDLVTSGDKPAVPSGRLNPWLVWSGVGLALMVLGLGGVFGYRRWYAPPPASKSSNDADTAGTKKPKR